MYHQAILLQIWFVALLSFHALYHYQGSWWTWLLVHLIRHSKTKILLTKLLYSNFDLLFFWAYKFFDASYHHQRSPWSWLSFHLICLSKTKVLKYYKAFLFKCRLAALLSFQISSILHIIFIKGVDEIECKLVWFFFLSQKFWCTIRLSISKF